MIDVKPYLRDLSRNRLYNLHTHTQFCDGRFPMEDFVKEAIRLGYRAIGFTPHCFVSIESPCNMERGNVDRYLLEIGRLRAVYGESIEILASMEVDFLEGLSGPADMIYQDLCLDYILGSVHFVRNFKGELIDVDGRPEQFADKLKFHFKNDLEYVVRKYYESMGEMLVSGGFDIIGHIDKIAFNANAVRPGIEHEDWYEKTVREIIDEAEKTGKPLEINTKIYEKEGRFFPAVRWWPELISSGVEFYVNSDAHYPDKLGSGREAAFEILERYGYRTASGTVERHPWEPFIPDKAKVLMAGTFPPGRKRWNMEFYYPNPTNDFWKMMGLLFLGDETALYSAQTRSYKLQEIKELVSREGIAMSDTVKTALRLSDNASDKNLEVVEENDMKGLLGRLPHCSHIGLTGEKATSIAATQFGICAPAMGKSVDFTFDGRKMCFWRLPSTSRAYPMPLRQKAEVYGKFFASAGCGVKEYDKK